MLGEPSGASHDPPPLTERYNKARSRYALTAALLLGWELVGVRFSGEPISWLGITLTSSEAAPYAIIGLLFYFALRTSLEWYQNSDLRRRETAPSIDFLVANLIGVAAVALFAFQQLAGAQLAAGFSASTPALVLLGFVLGFGVGELRRYFREGQTDGLRLTFFIVSGVVIPAGVVFLLRPGTAIDYAAPMLGLVAGVTFDLVIGRVVGR